MLLDSTVSKEMNNKQLRRAYKLIGSTMPDGSTYDGRFNLKGDLETIQWNFRNADINTEEGVAKNYGVSVEEYRLGQDWYNKNLVNENENSPIAINSSFSHFALGALISVSSYIFWKILKHLQPKTKNLPKNGAEMPNFQQND